jgi:ferredoxin
VLCAPWGDWPDATGQLLDDRPCSMPAVERNAHTGALAYETSQEVATAVRTQVRAVQRCTSCEVCHSTISMYIVQAYNAPPYCCLSACASSASQPQKYDIDRSSSPEGHSPRHAVKVAPMHSQFA